MAEIGHGHEAFFCPISLLIELWGIQQFSGVSTEMDYDITYFWIGSCLFYSQISTSKYLKMTNCHPSQFQKRGKKIKRWIHEGCNSNYKKRKK